MMKIGFRYAIDVLMENYRGMKTTHADAELLQQLKEGIEYLCRPWREDLTENIRSPLFEEGENSPIEDAEEVVRRGNIHVEMSYYVWDVLKEIGVVKG